MEAIIRLQSGAAWEDTKFGVRHFNDIERLAIISGKTWEKGLAYFCKAFTLVRDRYFDIDKRDETKAWVKEAEEYAVI